MNPFFNKLFTSTARSSIGNPTVSGFGQKSNQSYYTTNQDEEKRKSNNNILQINRNNTDLRFKEFSKQKRSNHHER